MSSPPVAEKKLASCFISFSTRDEPFPTQVYRDLRSRGIKCWMFNEDARLGETLWSEIDLGIRSSDKILLLASSASLQSPPVLREIHRAFELEDERRRILPPNEDKTRVNVLLPVVLDEYFESTWTHPRKSDIREKTLIDGRGAMSNGLRYQQLLNRILNAL